jgi:hypothetical protein
MANVMIEKNICWGIKASQIDNYSRVLFPAVFFSFHIVYWAYYLNISSSEMYNF